MQYYDIDSYFIKNMKLDLSAMKRTDIEHVRRQRSDEII
jgi:hypothetical protein